MVLAWHDEKSLRGKVSEEDYNHIYREYNSSLAHYSVLVVPGAFA